MFREVAAPRHIPKGSIARAAPWYTWSQRAKSLLSTLGEAIGGLEEPTLVHLRRGRGYDYTYTGVHMQLLEHRIGRSISDLAASLMRFSPGKHISFFTGLLGEDISGRALHYLFAIIRDAMVQQGYCASGSSHVSGGRRHTAGPSVTVDQTSPAPSRAARRRVLRVHSNAVGADTRRSPISVRW